MYFEQLKNIDWPAYRLKQVNQAVFKDLIDDWEQVTTLPKADREFLYENVPLSTLKLVNVAVSKSKDTIKAVFEIDNRGADKKLLIESVLMMHEGRNTVCVSCQAGCPVGCIFCATGKMGFKKNLSYQEIVDQVLFFGRLLKGKLLITNDKLLELSSWNRKRGTSTSISRIQKEMSDVCNLIIENSLKIENCELKISNVVFMGMGEPMLNIGNVSKSIDILTDDNLFGLGKRKITVSSSGYIKNLQTFLDDYPHIGLAISLHAPNQQLREKLMPVVSKTNNIDDLIDLARQYSGKTHRRVSFEYILIAGINDDIEHAHQLAKKLRNDSVRARHGAPLPSIPNNNFLYHINLIAYNPSICDIKIDNKTLKRPNTHRINRFKDELVKLGIPVSVRKSMGQDISAACGQLAGGK